MYLLSHRDSLVADSHEYVTGLFRDTIATAFCTCGEALEDCSLLDVDGRDFQLVDIRAIIVLGVRDCGLQNLLDDDSALFRAELPGCSTLDQLFCRGSDRRQGGLFGPTGARRGG